MATMAQIALQLARLQDARGEGGPAVSAEINRLLMEQQRQEADEFRERKWLMSKRKRESRARGLNATVERVRREAADPQVSTGEITSDEYYLRRYGMGRAERLATGGERPNTTQPISIQEVARALRASKRAGVAARESKQAGDFNQAFLSMIASPDEYRQWEKDQAPVAVDPDDIPTETMPPTLVADSLDPETADRTTRDPFLPPPEIGGLAALQPGVQPGVPPEESQVLGEDEVITPVVTDEEEAGKVPGSDITGLETAYSDFERASHTYAGALDVQQQAQAEIAQKYHEQRLQDEEVRKQSLYEADHELKEIIGEVKNFRINPNRIFPNTMSRLGAAISVAIGGFAEAYSGGRVRNTALDIINNAVQQDIEAQKARLQAGTQAMRGQENAYGKLLQRYEREDLATKALEIQELQLVKGRMTEMLTKAGITDPKNPLSMFHLKVDAQLKEKKLGLIKDRAEMMARKADSALNFAQVMKQNNETAGAKAAEDAAKIEELFNTEIPKEVQSAVKSYHGSRSVWDTYLQLAAGMKKNSNVPADFSLAKVLDKSIEFVTPSWMSTGERAQVNYLRQHLAVDWMKAKEGSRMTDKDREFYLRLFPSYKSTIFGPGAAHHMITTMMAIRNRGFVSMIDSQTPKVKLVLFKRHPGIEEFYKRAKHPAVKAAVGYYDEVQDSIRKDDAQSWWEKDTPMSKPPAGMATLTSKELEWDKERGIWVKKNR